MMRQQSTPRLQQNNHCSENCSNSQSLKVIDDIVKQCFEIADDNDISSELQRPIHHEIPIYYNSLNVYCGHKGSGKTYSCCSDIVKICTASDEIHMLIYISKSGAPHDATFDRIKHIIPVPIVYVAEDRAVSTVSNILKQKQLYHWIANDEGLEDRVEDDQIAEIKEALQVDDFSRKSLTTLIMLEDAANSPLLKRKDSYFSSLFTRLRHQDVRAIAFVIVQFWKSVEKHVKTQVTAVFLYRGFSCEDFNYTFRQLSYQGDRRMLWEQYKNMPQFGRMYINTLDGEVKFI